LRASNSGRILVLLEIHIPHFTSQAPFEGCAVRDTKRFHVKGAEWTTALGFGRDAVIVADERRWKEVSMWAGDDHQIPSKTNAFEATHGQWNEKHHK
jgi:hypothetical protein